MKAVNKFEQMNSQEDADAMESFTTAWVNPGDVFKLI